MFEWMISIGAIEGPFSSWTGDCAVQAGWDALNG